MDYVMTADSSATSDNIVRQMQEGLVSVVPDASEDRADIKMTAESVERSVREQTAMLQAVRDGQAPVTVLAELLRRFPNPEQILRGLPRDSKRVPGLAYLLETMGHRGTALAYVESILKFSPKNVGLLMLAAKLHLRLEQVNQGGARGVITMGCIPVDQQFLLFGLAEHG